MKKIKFIGIIAFSLLLFVTSVQANLCSSQNIFPNTATDSFTSTGDADEYMTIYTAKPSVFQGDFQFDYKIKSMPATSSPPEPPPPEPPSPLPTLPGK
ncbi:MAG: hypothetical protein ACTSO6_09980 [Promethearchaeota archaeon]